MTPTLRLPTLKELVLATAGALLLAAALIKVGPMVLFALAALVAVILLINRPELACAVALGAIVLLESNPDWGISSTARLYEYLPGFSLTGAEALLLIATGAAALQATKRGRLLLPDPFTPPLILMTVAIVAGVVTGAAAGIDGNDLFEAARSFIPLVLIPFVVINAVDPDHLRRAIGFVGGLATIKGVAGLAVLAAGLSASAGAAEERLTYLEAAPNFLMMLFLLCVFAALIAGVRLPAWTVAATPFVFAALLLSYRRSFYIATIAGALLVLLLASGQVGRRLLVPGLIVVVLGGWLALSSGIVTEVNGPVEERIESLDPGKVKTNDQDRYRIDERDNVLAELKDAPLTGLGLGVPWRARQPLSIENDGGRGYVHFAALYYWLKLGPMGVIAYLWLLLTAVVTGISVWRRHADPIVRVAALALGTGVVGLALAELTATFVGADRRMAAVLGALLGLLAIANAMARAAPRKIE
jgi:hypothetical protein